MPDYDKHRLQNSSLLDPEIAAPEASPEPIKKNAAGNLDSVLLRGVAWTAAVKWLTQVFAWGTTVVVARLLLPSDYGLVGMAAVYINLFTLFSEFGIGTALVTLQDLHEDQISQLNSLSVFVGLIGFLVSSAVAFPLAKFFRAPGLPFVVIVLSLGFVVSGLRTVPFSLLQKEMRFKLLAVIEGTQGFVQALVTLILAFLGFRYWALVLGILSFSVTPTLLTLIWRRHRFAVPRIASIRRAVHYGRHILIGRLSWAVSNDSDFIVAGRVLGEAPLGAYTLAWTLAHTPLEKLTTLVNRVTPSFFAQIQTQPEALRRYFRNITGVVALVIFPATFGIALVAPEFVSVVLGSKWHGVIIPLELLALHAIIRSNVVLMTPLLNVIGEERLVMWNSIVAMFVLPICFYIGSHWGTAGIASGWILIYPLLQIPLFLRTFRKIHLPASEYLRSVWPAVSGCAVMAAFVIGLKYFARGFLPLYAQLIAEIIVGGIAYSLTLLLLHRAYLRGILQFARRYRTPA